MPELRDLIVLAMLHALAHSDSNAFWIAITDRPEEVSENLYKFADTLLKARGDREPPVKRS